MHYYHIWTYLIRVMDRLLFPRRGVPVGRCRRLRLGREGGREGGRVRHIERAYGKGSLSSDLQARW